MRNRKLYKLTSETFELPFAVNKSRNVLTSPAFHLPMLSWPSGRPCYVANIYMKELFERGLSRKDGGGTLLKYAKNISHLIRYCFNNRIDFIALTDNQFTLFIKNLQAERKDKLSNIRIRDSNTVINIGRTCLDFLACVGKIHFDVEFLSVHGRIRATHKKGRDLYDRYHGDSHRYWHHKSFPTADPKRKRLPISSKNIQLIRNAILSISKSIYLRRRRQVMIKLLEITGGRRIEVVSIKTNDVRNAMNMSNPMLLLQNAKQPGGVDSSRYIPINKNDLYILVEFIDKYREQIIYKTIGDKNDAGYLLVSETTGKKLSTNTITQEIGLLCKEAKITEKACAHMFRHRFITKLFVAIIKEHSCQNPSDFRRALLDIEALKAKLQQWTGHKRISSLDTYLNLAFEEVSNFRKTYNIVSAKLAIDSFRSNIDLILSEISHGIPSQESFLSLERIASATIDDLDRCLNND